MRSPTNNHKMKIAIDIDGVLGHFFPEFINYYNKKHDQNKSIEAMKDTDLMDVLNINSKEFWDLFEEFNEKRFIERLSPLKYSKEVVHKLSKSHELFIVTSRTLKIEDQTVNWLDTHFNNKFSEIIHSGNHYYVGTPHYEQKNPTKAEICKELNADVIIEDDLKYAEECSLKGIKVFLMNAPWNQKENLHKKIIRVNDWNHILEEVNKTHAELIKR